MIEYYKKFNIELPNLDYDRVKGTVRDHFGSDTFVDYSISDHEYLHDFISPHLLFTIPPNDITVTEIKNFGAIPHTDHVRTALLFYYDSAGFETAFYETTPQSVEQAPPRFNAEGEPEDCDLRVYELDSLHKVTEYSARSGDLCLLNVRKIHSALNFKTDQNTRKLVRWLWNDHDYYTVLSSIRQIEPKTQ